MTDMFSIQMPKEYKASYSSGIFGSFMIGYNDDRAASQSVTYDVDEKEYFDADFIENTWDWGKEQQSNSNTTSIDQQDIIEKMNPSNFMNAPSNIETDEKSLIGQDIIIENKEELFIPDLIKQNSNYGALKHKSSEPCNIFPIPSYTQQNTKIMSLTLDLDINDFCNDRLETFMDELSNTLNIDRHLIDCLCVDKGSSIVWIKFNDLTQTALQSMVNSFIKPDTKMNDFTNKFKLNIHKTIDIKTNQFKQVINNLQMNVNNTSNVTQWLMSNINQLYPLIYTSLKSCHYKWEIIDCMVVDVENRVDHFVKHSGFKQSKLLFHGTETTSFASIIQNGFWINKNSIGKWYGIGAYVTSYPVYAMEYYCMKAGINIDDDPNLCITLIGSLVNIGNVREIYEHHIDELIPLQYDCNHVQVFGTGSQKFNPLSKQLLNNNKNKQERIYDEYSIRDNTRILPRYVIKLKKIQCSNLCGICLMEIAESQLLKLKCCGMMLHKDCLVETLKIGQEIRLKSLGCQICRKLIEISIKMKLDITDSMK